MHDSLSKRIRSLFPLIPFGGATGRIESLTGYVTRLARAHQMTTSRLVLEAIMPVVRPNDQGDDVVPKRRTPPWHGDPRGINGTGDRSDAWVRALEHLTGVGGLAELTVLSWAKTIPTHFMLRPQAAYCAACFQEDSDVGRDDREPYERLAWMVSEVEYCLVHGSLLLTSCPGCGRPRPPLATSSLPGNCPTCGKWLGARRAVEGQPAIDHWGMRMAFLVDDALARRSLATDIESIRQSIQVAVTVAAAGNRAQFARMVGVKPSAAHDWFVKSHPSLRTLLRIAAVVGSDVPSILSGSPRFGAHPPMQLPDHVRAERHRQHDWDDVHRRLRQAARTEPPQSLRAFLADIDVDRSNLRRRRMLAAKIVVLRADKLRADAAERRRASLTRQIEEIVTDLHRRGVSTSRRNVEAALPAGVSLRELALQDAWRRLR